MPKMYFLTPIIGYGYTLLIHIEIFYIFIFIIVDDYNKKNCNKTNSQVCQNMMDGKNHKDVKRHQMISNNNQDDTKNLDLNHKKSCTNNQGLDISNNAPVINGNMNDRLENKRMWPILNHNVNGANQENYERKYILRLRCVLIYVLNYLFKLVTAYFYKHYFIHTQNR